MNSFLLIVSCAVAGVFSQGVGFNSCQKVPASTGNVAIPAAKWYQVYRENKEDSAVCYTLSTSGTGAIKINQTLTSQNIPFSSVYLASVNKDSSWNVTSDNGALSSTNQFRTVSNNILVVFTCTKVQLMTLQPGVYSQSKTLSAADDKTVVALLTTAGLTNKDFVKADTSKC